MNFVRAPALPRDTESEAAPGWKGFFIRMQSLKAFLGLITARVAGALNLSLPIFSLTPLNGEDTLSADYFSLCL